MGGGDWESLWACDAAFKEDLNAYLRHAAQTNPRLRYKSLQVGHAVCATRHSGGALHRTICTTGAGWKDILKAGAAPADHRVASAVQAIVEEGGIDPSIAIGMVQSAQVSVSVATPVQVQTLCSTRKRGLVGSPRVMNSLVAQANYTSLTIRRPGCEPTVSAAAAWNTGKTPAALSSAG